MGAIHPASDAVEYAALHALIARIDDPNLKAQFDGFMTINFGQRVA